MRWFGSLVLARRVERRGPVLATCVRIQQSAMIAGVVDRNLPLAINTWTPWLDPWLDFVGSVMDMRSDIPECDAVNQSFFLLAHLDFWNLRALCWPRGLWASLAFFVFIRPSVQKISDLRRNGTQIYFFLLLKKVPTRFHIMDGRSISVILDGTASRGVLWIIGNFPLSYRR